MTDVNYKLPRSKPSFTLLSYGDAVMDFINATEQQLIQREQLYRYNQIPAVVVGPPDLDKPNWDKELYQKLEQMYSQTFDPMPYTSLPVQK